MKLSDEQKEIIEYVKQGKTNAFIAKELKYSERSIKRKLQKLYNEFGANNKASLVVEILSFESRGFYAY